MAMESPMRTTSIPARATWTAEGKSYAVTIVILRPWRFLEFRESADTALEAKERRCSIVAVVVDFAVVVAVAFRVGAVDDEKTAVRH